MQRSADETNGQTRSHLHGDGPMSRFPSPIWSGFSPAHYCTLLIHGDSLGAEGSIVVLDGPLSGLESPSQQRQCELPPMSTWNGPPHSFPADPTPLAATRCMLVGPCSILEVHLLRKTPGRSPHFQPWRGSCTGRSFEKSICWSERSGKTMYSTGIWFVDTFRAGVERQLLGTLHIRTSENFRGCLENSDRSRTGATSRQDRGRT